jgi:heme/copper-type cytochrome/quinol oxidase subunit 2
LWAWAAFVVFFGLLMLYFFFSVGPPPQAEQQGVLWFYVRHWLAGVVIFPVYILVFAAIVWVVARLASGARKKVQHSDG